MNKILISSIFSGIMISIGVVVYLNTPPLLGAFVFSIGLLSILQCKFHLFIGKVAYITSYKEIPYILTIIIGNLIGCCTMFAFPSTKALEIINNKLNTPIWMVLVEAILCNMLIYIAVEANKNADKIVVILAITAFILAGFEHSIANICFIIAAKLFNLETLFNTLTVLIGNTIGGLLIHNIRRMVIE